MQRRFGHFVLHYGIALVAVAAIYVVHDWVLSPLAGGARAPLTYLLAVALAAAYGGAGPGLFAVALGVVCGSLPLLLPQATHDGVFVELIRVALLAICGVIIAFLFGRLHLARARDLQATARLDLELQSRRAAERALQASREQFETMAAAVPDILYTATAKGGIEYLNPRWSEVTGLSCALCLGSGWRAAIHADDLAHVDAAVGQAQRGAAPYELRLRLRSASGVFRVFLMRALPLRDPQADVRWFGAMTDLDDLEQARAALRASEEHLQSALDAAEMGTFSLDLPGEEIALSARAMTMLGVDRPAATLEALRAQAAPGDWWRLKRAFARAADPARRARIREHLRLRVHGMERALLVSGAVTRGGGQVQRIAGILLDETAMRAAAARVEHAQTGLRLALEATQLGNWDYNLADEHLTLSPRAAAIYGLDADDAVASAGVRDLVAARIHGDDRARVQASTRTALDPAGPGRFEIEHRIVLPDGSVRWVVAMGQVSFRGEGAQRRAERLSGTLLDVTERRRALDAVNASEERFRLAAEAVDGLIYDWDLASGAVERTRGLESLLGWRPEDVAADGDWWLAQIHPEDAATWQTQREAIIARRGSRFDSEYRARHRDGHWCHVYDRALIVYGADGAPVRMVGCVQDVTAQRSIDQALRDADASKNRFLAQLAHELRTPLAPMRNAVALLASDGQEPQARQRHLGVLERQLAHAARLVDDLLDISRIAGDKLELKREPAAIADLVRSAVEAVRPLIDERQQRLEVEVADDAPRAWLDPVRVRQIVTNLLTNASKFTPARGRIVVSAAVDADRILIRVTDSGVGIPPESLERIFTMFSQLDHGDGAHSGLGIGLALSRTLAALHGGTLRATSDGVGHGATFEVTLPFVAADAARAPAPTATPKLDPQRIVVADDNTDSAESLAALLSISGHSVFVTHDGAGAVRMARALQPTLAILDLGMPGVDGFQAARMIRNEPGGGGIALIALSGFGQPADRERSRAAGFDMHLVKPIDPSQIDALLVQAVTLRAAPNA
jgi:PAS domain S-box-containing protein